MKLMKFICHQSYLGSILFLSNKRSSRVSEAKVTGSKGQKVGVKGQRASWFRLSRWAEEEPMMKHQQDSGNFTFSPLLGENHLKTPPGYKLSPKKDVFDRKEYSAAVSEYSAAVKYPSSRQLIAANVAQAVSSRRLTARSSRQKKRFHAFPTATTSKAARDYSLESLRLNVNNV